MMSCLPDQDIMCNELQISNTGMLSSCNRRVELRFGYIYFLNPSKIVVSWWIRFPDWR